jgi:hypothetical protein
LLARQELLADGHQGCQFHDITVRGGSSIDKLAGLFYPAGWHALVVGAGG